MEEEEEEGEGLILMEAVAVTKVCGLPNRRKLSSHCVNRSHGQDHANTVHSCFQWNRAPSKESMGAR